MRLICENQNGPFLALITRPINEMNSILIVLGRALDVYNAMYDKILLAGDFNAEEHETGLNKFLQLVKDKTCFKSLHRPTCIDLLLTNCD